ncbi:MAG: SHOCT domain-containing protein [Caldilineaceae bacterium]
MQTVTHIFLDGWLGGGRMMGMGRGFFFFPGGLFTLLSLLLLIALLIWAIRVWSGSRQTPVPVGTDAGSWGTGAPAAAPSAIVTPVATTSATTMAQTPVEILQMRYAKGEVTRAEYDTIRADLLRDRPQNDETTGNQRAAVVAESEIVRAPKVAAADKQPDELLDTEQATADDDEATP